MRGGRTAPERCSKRRTGQDREHGCEARLVGINHVALEVGDLDEALEFYGRIFDIELESRIPEWPSSGWATSSWRCPRAAHRLDEDRHFGLVVEDRDAALAAARKPA